VLQERKDVGVISHRGKDYSVNLMMPPDALALVIQMMLADKYRYVSIEAQPSYRGEALVHNYGFSGVISD
jgi:hypothetical protein